MSLSTLSKRSTAAGWCLLVAGTAMLASCDDNYCGNCGGPPPVEYSFGLVAGNFNDNGHISVVATSAVAYYPQFNPGYLKSYLSTGAGSFAAPVYTNDGYDPLYLASADLNNDHVPDVVSASYSDGVLAVFMNNPATPGVFANPIVLTSPGASQVAIGDMNSDGLPDLVSADFNVSLFLQTAPGVFANPIGLYAGGANWVAVGDLNHDGIPDIALTDAVGVKVLLHVGAATAPTYSAPISVFTQTANANVSGANIIAIADVNGDGFGDLIITDPGPTGGNAPTVSVLLQNPAHPGTFLAAVPYALPASSFAQSIVVTDVDGDGLPDIVVGGSGAVSVLLQNAAAAGTFKAAANYAVINAYEIAVADVNGDGRPDIVIGTGASQPVVNGVVTNTPGVLLQSSTVAGTFGALQNLP